MAKKAAPANTPAIDPEKQYRIRIGRPIRLDADTVLLPSHEEITVAGALLAEIADQVLDYAEV